MGRRYYGSAKFNFNLASKCGTNDTGLHILVLYNTVEAAAAAAAKTTVIAAAAATAEAAWTSAAAIELLWRYCPSPHIPPTALRPSALYSPMYQGRSINGP